MSDILLFREVVWMKINWPDEYKPENSSVHVKNELLMPGVELLRTWEWICRPDLWPSWYPNSSRVRVTNQSHQKLCLGTTFRWRTFGVTIDSTVLEFVEHQRLAWDAHCNGVHAYHAWAFEPIECGVYVLTEETQRGWLARLGHLAMPGRMYKWHQRWLEELGKVSGSELRKEKNS